jgi:hypothetical protein
MLFVYSILIVIIGTVAIGGVLEAIGNKVKVERSKRSYANLPIKVLVNHVWRDEHYRELYFNLKQLYPDDMAARLSVKRMLTDRGILKYRKERL